MTERLRQTLHRFATVVIFTHSGSHFDVLDLSRFLNITREEEWKGGRVVDRV